MWWGVSDPGSAARAGYVIKQQREVALQAWFVVKKEKKGGAGERNGNVLKLGKKDYPANEN